MYFLPLFCDLASVEEEVDSLCVEISSVEKIVMVDSVVAISPSSSTVGDTVTVETSSAKDVTVGMSSISSFRDPRFLEKYILVV